jgi:hypothetical protein
MILTLAIVVGVAITGLALLAIAVVVAMGLQPRLTRGERASTDPIWVAIGLTVIALVCCLGILVLTFIFGVPVLPVRR